MVEIDLRNNPVTIGFYIPQDVPAVVQQQGQMVIYAPSRIQDHGVEITNDVCADVTSPKLPIRGRYLSQSYTLPAQDATIDKVSRGNLDEDTALRRRVYEMLVTHACPRLEHLDGLDVDRPAIGHKDAVWSRLIEIGVLKGELEM